jgi:integrase
MKQKLKSVAECLYRAEPSGVYYAIYKREGKQIKRSLKTRDPALAKRRRRELESKVEQLDSNRTNATFGHVLGHYRKTALAAKTIKGSTRSDIENRIQRIIEFWPDDLERTRIADITTSDCELWFAARRKANGRWSKGTISPQRLNSELGILKEIFEFAKREHYTFDNPVTPLKWSKVPKPKVVPPTREQFAKLIAQLRATHNGNAADFCELLAYSGMRCNEAASLLWADVDFDGSRFTVTGGEKGTKNGQTRVVPLFQPMRDLLLRIRKEQGDVSATNRIMKIWQCWDRMKFACRDAGLPHFSHHDLRHFFCSNAIEQNVPYHVVAAWLGHLDGGQLVCETYGHLRQGHSDEMAQKMTFMVDPTDSKVVPFAQSA